MENKEPIIMRGAPVAEHMLTNLTWDPSTILYILSNQEDPASAIYVRNKKKKCEEVGIRCEVIDISDKTFEAVDIILYGKIRDNPHKVYRKYYVIIQKPLPKQLQPYEKELDKFFQRCPETDIDAFGGDLSTEFRTPATPLGIIKMLDYYIVGLDKLNGLNAVVIGRSEIVGKPMADLLLKYNCTVTICHSHTKNLKEYTRMADLIVSAVGKPKFLTADYINPVRRPIVVDVGINRDENNKLCGDVDFEQVSPLCSYISPVPGGVGVLTVASLIYKMGEKKNENI